VQELLSPAAPDIAGFPKLTLDLGSSVTRVSSAVTTSGTKRDFRACDEPQVRVERGVKLFRHSRICVVFGDNAGDLLLSFSPKDWEEVLPLEPSDPIWSTPKLKSCQRQNTLVENVFWNSLMGVLLRHFLSPPSVVTQPRVPPRCMTPRMSPQAQVASSHQSMEKSHNSV
jgi:hypothetical protein